MRVRARFLIVRLHEASDQTQLTRCSAGTRIAAWAAGVHCDIEQRRRRHPQESRNVRVENDYPAGTCGWWMCVCEVSRRQQEHEVRCLEISICVWYLCVIYRGKVLTFSLAVNVVDVDLQMLSCCGCFQFFFMVLCELS